MMVLGNPMFELDDLYPNNLLAKPFFVVNGGRDPLYPTRAVEPYVEHLKKSGVDLLYRPQPTGVHNTTWWPDVKDSFEEFVRTHPRNPLPQTLTWESNGQPLDSRADWLVIDKLAPPNDDAEPLADLNTMGNRGDILFEEGDPPD